MVTVEQVLELMVEPAYKPMTYQELEKEFKIDGAQEFKDFLQLLTGLENDGRVFRGKGERYGLPERMDLVRGRLQAHAKGFGFLIPENREHADVYIGANDMKGAMNGDILLVKVTKRGAAGGKLEGEIVKIVKRSVARVVGTFQHHETYGFVLPDDKRINRDIFIPQNAFMGADEGQKVVVNIVNYPEGKAAAEGEIIEILGHKNDPGVDILSIIRKHGLPEAFPDEVMAEAEKAPDSITEEEIVQQGRRDLRGERIVTIDGADAKDLDDAVQVVRLENGNYKLGVHIADVSYYVREGSKLDQEAYNRGCSVYLVDRVIPMLPHRLSNGICSLNPQVDRLTMSCEMEFDAETMKVVKHDIFTSVIRTTERMTYTNVKLIITGEADEELKERYAHLLDDFSVMAELSGKLRKRRMNRGAIDFDFKESKVIVDEEGKPVDIIQRERSVAEMLIEEFMLAANETVAEHFHWLKVPFLYRIHEDPDQEKLMNFAEFVTNFGHALRGGRGSSVHPKSLQALLEDIKGTKEETVISTVMLRSMKQAKYDAESTGHFGLAAEFYSHFTSPIRRYPDLVIHRVIREILEAEGRGLSDKRHEYLAGRMSDIATQSSERERVAVDAERDTDQLKKCEFMLDKVGEEFVGMISSVTGFGMFIELPNSVEGLIRLSDMNDDYYNFHENQLALIGERTSKIYRIGDEVKIRVARVNMDDHTIDFEMADAPKGGTGTRDRIVERFTGRGARGGEGGFGGGRGGKGRGKGGFGEGSKAGGAPGGGRGKRSESGPAGGVSGGGRGKRGKGGAGGSVGVSPAGGQGEGRKAGASPAGGSWGASAGMGGRWGGSASDGEKNDAYYAERRRAAKADKAAGGDAPAGGGGSNGIGGSRGGGGGGKAAGGRGLKAVAKKAGGKRKRK
ncbi:ribonuclease R [Paenibacillus swuensis]|uniref:Ribonuclease R n=1 Tax=Paenibacillus swuensis TaxID=1178515 RepID=A0A172TIS0_9BACL|nr:ribonuclease R [Paenibacillus swuensis]ANE46862.1 ribonuclease R [Paenibacillus swuensis]